MSCKIEWQNGDECVWSVGAGSGVFIGYYPLDNSVAYVCQGEIVFPIKVVELSKPETPEQKAAREREEMAERLYYTHAKCYFWGLGDTGFDWGACSESCREVYLKMVDEGVTVK